MALNRDGDTRGRASERSSRSGGASSNKSNGNTTSGRFMSPIGRMSFNHLYEAEETDTGPKYNVTLLFPPGTDLRPLKDLLYDAMEAKFGPKKDWPKGVREPEDVFGDCGEKDYTGYKEGWTYVKFSSADAPGIVDAGRAVVDDRKQVYNGRWARVSGTAYAYDKKSKGCAFGLNNVQLLQNDETFSGRPRAEDEFDDKYKDEVEEDDRKRGGRGGSDRGGRDDDRDSRDDRSSRDRDDRGRGRSDRDDNRGRSRRDDDSRDRDGGSDRGRGRDRDEDRDSRSRDRDDDRSSYDKEDHGRPGGSDRGGRGRDDRDRGEDRGRGRDEDDQRSGRDRDRDAGSDRDRERGRSREDDRDAPRSRDADRAEPRQGRDRDEDRGSSRGSRDRDDDRDRSRGRSRDEDDRFRD